MKFSIFLIFILINTSLSQEQWCNCDYLNEFNNTGILPTCTPVSFCNEFVGSCTNNTNTSTNTSSKFSSTPPQQWCECSYLSIYNNTSTLSIMPAPVCQILPSGTCIKDMPLKYSTLWCTCNYTTFENNITSIQQMPFWICPLLPYSTCNNYTTGTCSSNFI